jgi:S-adenosylmethionine:tRNA ribosyltransferase-isomerase
LSSEIPLDAFDYELPKELIAQEPTTARGASRLLHFDKTTQNIQHDNFSNIVDRLPKNCVLVFNDTKVIKARVIAKRKSGAKIECFFIEKKEKNIWKALIKNSRKVNEGETLFVHNHHIVILEKNNQVALIKILGTLSDLEFLDALGETPLPPYIKSNNPNQHFDRYQTVFATTPGAVAAPTASLHFTNEILAQLKAKNIEIIYITLHIGLGTFNPIKTKNIYDHTMHYETYNISKTAAKQLNKARKNNQPIFAVGTTVIRCLESNIKDNAFRAEENTTNLFITPEYEFKCISGIITNFHLPKSSLLILISSFIGKNKTLELYKTAVKNKYRFFSFGDAMLIT